MSYLKVAGNIVKVAGEFWNPSTAGGKADFADGDCLWTLLQSSPHSSDCELAFLQDQKEAASSKAGCVKP